ncbi:hypothetical protein GCM10022215_29710 [Nocardioides fonticola]|uniref:Uncharacterized protein n=1 Tax=Nocardioides fonticola TaxID=450363 RepID=A0ABP7XPL3_9ACTN
MALPEQERGWWIARWEIEQDSCPQCGRPREECGDPTKRWYPQRSICYATREAAAAQRMYDHLHAEKPFHDGTYSGWVKDFAPGAGKIYRYEDGASIWAAPVDLNPEDKFLAGG